MQKRLSTQELRDIIKKRMFWIYGCGAIAKRLCHYINAIKAEENLQGFIVSAHNSTDDTCLYEKPIINVCDGNRDATILIATDVTNAKEIEATLEKLGFQRYIWIYSHLFDLEFGDPIEYDMSFVPSIFFHSSNVRNWLTVCYLVIEDYYSCTEEHKGLYIHYSELWFSTSVAEKDWSRFIKQIRKFDLNGFRQEYNIKIGKDLLTVLDGAHRIALAQFYHHNIIADIYDCDMNKYRETIGNTGGMNKVDRQKDEFLKQYLDTEEMSAIKKAQRRLLMG